MSLAREERHLPYLITICFLGNFVLGGVGQFLAGNNLARVFIWKWSALLYMSGASLYAAKLHTDRWHISSAGFILVSIGQGIFYTLLNTVHHEEDARLFADGIMTFIPGMFFICYYSGFPIWLRMLNVLATVPFLMVLLQVDFGWFTEMPLTLISPVGFALIQISSLLWCYYAFRPYHKIGIQE